MSACEQFRQYLVSEMNRLAEKGRENPGSMEITGDILWQFDALHQSNQENTGDGCKGGLIRSAGYEAAEKEMRKRSSSLTAYDFGDYQVRVVHEEGSVFHIKNSFLGNWMDDDGTKWVFLFCEHFPAMLFDDDDLIQCEQLKTVEQ